MKILNFGSLNLDYVYQVPHFVRPGETVAALKRDVNCGGKGLNQSISLARAGMPVHHAGAVGSDGDILCKALEDNGVDTSHVKRMADRPSGHAVIQVEKGGQNSIIVFGGANREISREHVDSVLEAFSPGDFLILQNEINNIDYIIRQGNKKGMRVVLNPSPIDEDVRSLPLELVELFLVNEVETAELCGSEQLEDAVRTFPHAKIVMTLGSRGALYWDGSRSYSHGVYDVEVVDTTAAGDTFTGFFISSLAKGRSAGDALRMASAAASIAISRHGAQESIPSMEEVLAAHPELDKR